MINGWIWNWNFKIIHDRMMHPREMTSTSERWIAPVTATKHLRMFAVPCQDCTTWLSLRYLWYLCARSVLKRQFNILRALELKAYLLSSIAALIPSRLRQPLVMNSEASAAYNFTNTDSTSTSGTSDTSCEKRTMFTCMDKFLVLYLEPTGQVNHGFKAV